MTDYVERARVALDLVYAEIAARLRGDEPDSRFDAILDSLADLLDDLAETEKPTRRAAHLWNRYRLRPEDYDRMLAEQSGVCAICKNDPALGKHLDVDHDHASGRVRGLLCRSCNIRLGLIETGFVDKALEYLREASVDA